MTKGKGGDLIYKCRHCGKIIRDTHVPDLQLAMIAMTSHAEHFWMKDWGTPMHITEVHYCDLKNIGVTDLIGGEYDE